MVQAHLDAGATAVLPVGAACKGHGWHLPMNTDRLQAEWFAQELTKGAHVVVWPAVGYGHYPAFIDYPGTCSVSSDAFEVTIYDILTGILRSGARTTLILNTGISTIRPLQAAIRRAGSGRGITLVTIYDTPRYREAASRLTEQVRGGHADEMETSIMLAIAPNVVRMDKAVACMPQMRSGPFNRTEAGSPNYSPSGVYGDPKLATREKGEVLVKAILLDLMDALGGSERLA
ncbi:MAG: creatininase family protein [Gammaproteobacteria bacterium]|nr:creatininase family protein [Gammaproteobacteria bacterium]